jgi:glucose/arabinose dehydrogenase
MPRHSTPRRRVVSAVLLTALAGCSSSSTTDPSADVLLDLQPVISGLAAPVYLTAPAGDARLFVVEQPGRIRIVKNGQLLAAPFLDISARVSYGGERGLLSMAFDPQYAANGFFYVYYTSAPTGDIVVERYGGTAGADVASATPTPVIAIPHPGASNHNGGLVMFGPDGMLYLGTGDGGGAGDPSGNGQNVNVLLGKLLRLDVRTLPYTVPPGNPFVGQAGKRGEIWAYGLRNPWRFAFDRGSANLYIADVGQSLYEEVNVAPPTSAGLDYGWNVMEGQHCYPSGDACNTAALVLPLIEYSHASGGCSITGGFVYRGAAIPEVRGQYFYSDYCAGFLASFGGTTTRELVTRSWSVPNVGSVVSFGEDAAGELYVLSANGTVYRIVRR